MTERDPTPEEEAEFEAAKPELAEQLREEWAIQGENAISCVDASDDVDAVTDTLTVIMHMCKREEIDFAQCLKQASFHFDAESADKGDDLMEGRLLEMFNERDM